jgi:hypothetical protein
MRFATLGRLAADIAKAVPAPILTQRPHPLPPLGARAFHESRVLPLGAHQCRLLLEMPPLAINANELPANGTARRAALRFVPSALAAMNAKGLRPSAAPALAGSAPCFPHLFRVGARPAALVLAPFGRVALSAAQSPWCIRWTRVAVAAKAHRACRPKWDEPIHMAPCRGYTGESRPQAKRCACCRHTDRAHLAILSSATLKRFVRTPSLLRWAARCGAAIRVRSHPDCRATARTGPAGPACSAMPK